MRSLPVRDIVRLATGPLVKGRTVDLTHLDVDAALDLSGMRLANLDFSGSVFRGPVIARDAVFQGLAWFKGCRFEAAVDFSRAVFSNDLRMKGSTVLGPVTMTRAELHGMLDLDGVRLEDRADLDRMLCFGNASLDATRFLAPVTLQATEFLGGLWCNGTEFASRADFREVEVHGRTWLRNMRRPPGDLAGPRDAARDIQSYGYRWI